MRIAPSLDFTFAGPTMQSPSQPPTAMTLQSSFRGFVQMLQKVYRNLATAFNGNIGFGDGVSSDNISGNWVSVNFPSANTDVTVTHNLGRIPVGYLAMTKSQAGDIFTGSVAATKTQITLQSSTAGQMASLFIL